MSMKKVVTMLALAAGIAGADAKDQPNSNKPNFSAKTATMCDAAPYLVIDLSGGANAASYPVRFSATGPDLASDTCRTTELWLRLIPPGTFIMGSPTTELGHDWYGNGYETQHPVTLSKPFYMGVFEMTQKQYMLVMGSNPSTFKGDTRPVECVPYNALRGSLDGANWPSHGKVDADSFFGKIRARTSLMLDLPTEAMWEYACRAGTTTALNNGKNLEKATQDGAMEEVGRYSYNKRDGKGGYSPHTKVGSYAPNAWGLYDMHGNVAEWCLDWWQSNLGTTAVTDPKGATSGCYRLVRGGCWFTEYNAGAAAACRSAYRCFYYIDFYHDYRYTSSDCAVSGVGFRIACFPAE